MPLRVGRAGGTAARAPSGGMALIAGEADGFGINATIVGGSVAVLDSGTPANNLNNVAFSASNLVQASASGKYVRDSAGVLTLLSAGVVPQSYDPVGGKYGILIEPAATNLILQSQTLDNASWTKNTCSVTADATAAPDGTTTADKVVEDNTTGGHFLRQDATITNNAIIAYSVYAKKLERDGIQITLQDTASSNGVRRFFDLTAGTVGTAHSFGSGWSEVSCTIEAMGSGWYRCMFVAQAAGTALRTLTQLAGAAEATNYLGDNTSGLYFWGVQVEEGSSPTSYIPTTTGTVTRAIDAISVLTSTFPFSATNGTIYADAITSVAVAASQVIWQLDDGTANERMLVWRDTSNNPTTSVVDGGVSQVADDAGTLANSTRVQATFAYKANDFDISWDGAGPTSDGSGSLPTVTTLRLGRDHSASGWNSFIYRLVYVPRQVETTTANLATWRYNT